VRLKGSNPTLTASALFEALNLWQHFRLAGSIVNSNVPKSDNSHAPITLVQSVLVLRGSITRRKASRATKVKNFTVPHPLRHFLYKVTGLVNLSGFRRRQARCRIYRIFNVIRCQRRLTP